MKFRVTQNIGCRTYANAYVLVLKVDPLRARTHKHTLAPSIPLPLKAPSEGVLRNFLEFGRRIRFDIFRICEM
jgi:hypothetical protein